MRNLLTNVIRAVLFFVALGATGQTFASVQFATNSYVTTDTSGTATITVVLTNEDSTSAPVTVNYTTTGGSATPEQDYQPQSGTLIWNTGDFSTKTISIPLIDDVSNPGNYTVNIQLFDPSGTSMGAISTATLTIESSELAANGQFSFSASDYVVSDNAGSATLTVHRLNGSKGAVSVSYGAEANTGTAQIGVDYSSTPGTLSWADGDVTDKTFTIPVMNPGTTGPDVTAQFELFNPTGGSSLGSQSTTTLTIVNTNAGQAGTIAMAAATETVVQSAGTAQVFVNRVGGTNGAASVQYFTSPGTADATRFTPESGILTWSDGDASSKVISIPITDNGVSEPASADFTVNLANVQGASLGTPASTDVSILGTTTNSSTIAFTQQTYTVVNNQPSVTLTIVRSGTGQQIASPASVQVATADASAKAGTDYSAISTTVTWAAGEADSQTVVVPIASYQTFTTAQPPDKFFVVNLSSPTGATLSNPNQALVDIQSAYNGGNNSTLQFQTAEIGTAVLAGYVAVPIERTTSSTGAVSVTVNTVDGSAVGGTDYSTVTNQVVSWVDGDTSPKYVVVPLLNPATPHTAPVYFELQLTSPTGPAQIGPNSVSVINIVPTAPSVIELSSVSYSVSDGDGSLQVVVTRTGPVDGTVSVQIATENGTAIGGTNYTQLAPTTLTWAPGDTSSRVVVIQIAPPTTTAQPTVNFEVVLSNYSGNFTPGPNQVATVTISDVTAQLSTGLHLGAFGFEALLPMAAFGAFRRGRRRNKQKMAA